MAESKRISNEMGKNFPSIEGRKKIIEEYANSEFPFFGENEDGEKVELHVAESGIILKTYQNNGWLRANYYDADGYLEGETFEGRWNK